MNNWFLVFSAPRVSPCTCSPLPSTFSPSSSHKHTHVCEHVLSLTPTHSHSLSLSWLSPEGRALCLCLLSASLLLEAGIRRGCTHSLGVPSRSLHCSRRFPCPLYTDDCHVGTSGPARTPFPAGGPDFH